MNEYKNQKNTRSCCSCHKCGDAVTLSKTVFPVFIVPLPLAHPQPTLHVAAECRIIPQDALDRGRRDQRWSALPPPVAAGRDQHLHPRSSVSRTPRACYPLPWKAFLLLPAPQASDSFSPSRDLLSALQPQPGLSSLPLSFLSPQTVLQLEVVDPSPGLAPPHQNISPMRAGVMKVSFTTLLLTPSPLPGTWGMFNEYSPNEWMTWMFNRIYQNVCTQRNICLNGPPTPYSTVRGHVLGGRYGFPFSLLPSLCCITVSSEGDSKDKGWKRKRKKKAEGGQGLVGLRQGWAREAWHQTCEKAESRTPRGGHPEPVPASTVGDPSWTQAPKISLS